jgi:cytochrome c
MSTRERLLERTAPAAAIGTLAVAVALAFGAPTARADDSPHLGKPVTEDHIKAWDDTVLPDGTNLPAGSGTAAEGAKLFVDKGCNQCHGDNGKGGISNKLVGSPSLTVDGIASNKTIANFWAYPTTVFDYIRRAMPWPTPHTLSDDEVYAICAYLFAANELIPQDQPMNAQTLPKVKMPNHDNFIIKFPNRI